MLQVGCPTPRVGTGSKCGSCKSCEPWFLLWSPFPLVPAVKVLAGQLVSFVPSLPLFPSILLHPLHAAGSPGTALGGFSTSSDTRQGEGHCLRVYQNLTCAPLGSGHT